MRVDVQVGRAQMDRVTNRICNVSFDITKRALVRRVIARQNKDWSASAYYWTSYLDHRDWNLAREEARGGLDESKSQGGVAKAPPSAHKIPVKAVPTDPVSRELGKAQKLMATGNKEAAYNQLDKLIKRHGSTPGLPADSAKSLSRARVMHEDLGIELGKGHVTVGP